MSRLTKRTPSGWALAAPCAPGVPLAMLARYENIGSAHQFRHLSELNTPKSRKRGQLLRAMRTGDRLDRARSPLRGL